MGMNPRMNPPPRGPGMGPMGSYPGMRGPNSIGPGGGPIPGPMMGGQRPWTPNTSTPMNYSSSSPGSYGVIFANSVKFSKNFTNFLVTF